MIRRLIILLLIVGCDNSTESGNNTSNVAWLIAGQDMYRTEDNFPTIKESKPYNLTTLISGTLESCAEENQSLPAWVNHIECESYEWGFIYTLILDNDNDTCHQIANKIDSVNSIIHFKDSNYFEINSNSIIKQINPNDYTFFRYQY